MKPLGLYSMLESRHHVLPDLGHDVEIEEPISEQSLLESHYPFWDTDPVPLPDPYMLWGLFRTLQLTDYPVGLPQLPLMSRYMLDVLKGLGDFPHRTYNTVIYDMEVGNDPSEEDLPLEQRRYTEDYVLMQITEHLHIFDYDLSEHGGRYHTVQGQLMDEVNSVRKYVLRCDPERLPPVFKLAMSPTELFLTEQTKRVLEMADVQGIYFKPLKAYIVESEPISR